MKQTAAMMTEMKLPMKTSIDTTPVLVDGPADGLSGIPYPTTDRKGRDGSLRTCRKINTAHDGRVTHRRMIPELPV